MKAAGSAWRESPHFKNRSGVVAECADCHIPPGAGSLVLSKAQSLRELWVHFTERPTEAAFAAERPQRIKRAWKRTADEACRRCHDVDQVVPLSEQGKIAHSINLGGAQCVACHSSVGHRPDRKGEKP